MSKTKPMTAVEYLEAGDAWADRVSRLAFPILLWVAQRCLTLTYKELAQALATEHGEEIKGRMTLYGHPPGKIGFALRRLSDEWGDEIPPLGAVVVNAATRLPGSGADLFLRRYLNQTARKRLTRGNRRECTLEVIEAIHDYPDWKKVAAHFGISKLTPVDGLEVQEKPIRVPRITTSFRGGEGDEHRHLKEWVKENPLAISRFGTFQVGRTEEPLASGDQLDVYFHNRELRLGVEVKAFNAPEAELFRGIFQCVKYRATLRAMQLAEGDIPNAQTVLIVQRPLVGDIRRLARRLRVEWIDLGKTIPSTPSC